MRLALYQPDIPQNTGTILRLAACLDVAVDIIGPAGFDMTDKALRRAGLDYLDNVKLCRHTSWDDFVARLSSKGGSYDLESPPGTSAASREPRLILLTTTAQLSFVDFAFHPGDILLLGRESAGVPSQVHDFADARIAIPMRRGHRSLNIAVAAAMVLGEALRQTVGFAPLDQKK